MDIVKAITMAEKETLEELENALQGLEFQLNTRESSRGDYPSKQTGGYML